MAGEKGKALPAVPEVIRRGQLYTRGQPGGSDILDRALKGMNDQLAELNTNIFRNYVVLPPGATPGEFPGTVKVDGNDSTAGFLADKVVVSPRLRASIIVGSPGITGTALPQIIIGAGATGPTGPAGPTGAAGAAGAPGLQGSPGVTGPAGSGGTSTPFLWPSLLFGGM